MSAARDSNGSSEEAQHDDSDDAYVARYASDETSSDDSQGADEAEEGIAAEEDEGVQTGNPSRPRRYKTSVKKRARSHIKRLRESMTRFLSRFSKDNWAAQSSATTASADGPVEAQEQPSCAEAALTEAAPSVEQNQGFVAVANPEVAEPTAAPPQSIAAGVPQRLTGRQRKKALVEPHAFLAISMPDGQLVFYSSQGIKDDELARHQRDMFVGALSLMAKEERIRGSNDRRAELAARKLVNNSMELAGNRHLPLSKQWRQCARQAFTTHIQPTNGGLKMCPDEQHQWKQCVVGPGSETCTAGGLCKQARDAHGWPNDLPCINPARVNADTDWHEKLLLWQQSLGRNVTFPEKGTQR